jgi:hypothetical protein
MKDIQHCERNEMKRSNFIFFLLGLFFITLFSCEKEIDITLPEAERKLVVEGNIEQGQPPFVMLTKTQGYFDPTDLESLQNSFIHGAIVTVSNGTNTVQLQELCTSQLPDSLKPAVAELIGVPLESILLFDFCLYSTLDQSIYGEIGKTYALSIQAEGKNLSATTSIPIPVPMNRYWYKDQPGFTNFGYLWFELADPAPIGNSYRIYTQRKGKDSRFIPAGSGSVFEDRLFNGLTFDAFMFRGQEPNSNQPDDVAETSVYFEQGDTIYVKFCSIDQPHYQFLESFETAAFSNGNPFAAPATIKSNINGGLGVWGGYAATFDTLIALD